jgi:ABC-type multidrug transport system ATPase subunit
MQAKNAPPVGIGSQVSLTVVEQYNGRERTFIYPLDGASQVKIGRTPAGGSGGPNQLILEAPFVSRDQGLILPDEHGHRLMHLGGDNAFSVSEQPVLQQHALRDGDVLSLYDPASGGAVRITYTNPLRPALATSATIPLDGIETLTLGRQGAMILLQHPTVSRKHATIIRRPDGRHLLIDGGGPNGTSLNGQQLRGGPARLLAPQDVIRIGPFRLVYTGNSLTRHDERGAFQIDVRNMSLRVPSGRMILDDVSLSIAPREFVALVGGSGAGKSTLMKAICGFSRALSGNKAPVTVNGDDYYANFDAFRPQLGYVPQDDILHSSLTVREALTYTARLRLPDIDAPMIKQRIDDALGAVQIDPKHHITPIEKLSGGQRKRVSIASELLAEPSLFFLDEPTSGLDPGLDLKMMELLRSLAENGRSVILVTHATENIKACHQVAFMADGHLVYYGPPDEALSFFGVEKFSQIYTRLDREGDASAPWFGSQLGAELAMWRSEHRNEQDPPLSVLWKRRYLRSSQYRRFVTDRQSQASRAASATPNAASVPARRQRPSVLGQYALLTQRYFSLLFRDWRNLLTLLLQAPIIAVMLLILSTASSFTGITSVESRVARVEAQNLAFLLVAVSVWFGIINSARELTKESAIYRRERLSNLGIGTYLASKLTGLSLLALIQNLLLLLIVGMKVRFPAFDPPLLTSVWLEIFIGLMLVSLAGTALGLLISAFAASADQAISIVPLALIPQILFAGLIFDIAPRSVSEWISWLMISRWGLDALGTSLNLNALCQLPNVDYEGSIQPQCAVTDQLSTSASGTQVFGQFPFLKQGLEDASNFAGAFAYTSEHLLSVWGTLAAFILVGLLLTAGLLKGRDAQR